MSAVIASAIKHTDVQDVVMYRSLVAALAVANEAPETPYHAARLAFAQRVIRGEMPAERLTALVMTNSTIAAAVESAPSNPGAALDEGDIDYQLGAIWTALARSYAET